MKTLKILASASAILAMTQAQIAMAQVAGSTCIKRADLADAVVYSMPSLIGAFEAKCGASLPANGFIRTKGPQLAATYTARQTGAWPGARRVLLNFAQGNAKARSQGMGDFLANLPPEAIMPIVDALIQQEVSKEIPVKDCGNIEQVITLLAPLPPENLGGLTAFLFQLAKVKEPAICGAG